MTDIAFHSGVSDKLAYACRLLRKAYRSRARVVVSGSAEALSRLDKLLWVFDDLEFVPHLLARAGASVPGALQRTPIWLVEPGASMPPHEVLLNLGDGPAVNCERHARVIELVSQDADDRDAGRRRWREYEARGHTITHHVAAA